MAPNDQSLLSRIHAAPSPADQRLNERTSHTAIAELNKLSYDIEHGHLTPATAAVKQDALDSLSRIREAILLLL